LGTNVLYNWEDSVTGVFIVLVADIMITTQFLE